MNPVLEIRATPLSEKTGNILEIGLHIQGVDLLQKVYLLQSFAPGSPDEAVAVDSTQALSGTMRLKTDLPLSDTTYLWIGVQLKPNADLLAHVAVSCTDLRVASANGGSLLGSHRTPCSAATPLVPLRLGIALRQQGQDGVHTSRIPGITTSVKGTLLAIFDARRELGRDLQGDIDIALHRSTDGGRTWGPMQVVLDKGTWGGLPQKYNGVSDACILSDTVTGDLFVAGTWMYGLLDKKGKFIEGLNSDSTVWEHQWRNRGSQPGWDVRQTAQFLITRSTDDGLTWSEPINITRACKKASWWLLCPAPGNGITLRDGTLVFPAQGRNEQGVPFSCLVYSQDHGTTWHVSNPAYSTSTNECAVVELSDGALLLSMRCHDNRGKKEGAGNGRALAITYDLGQTWTEHPASRHALIEPICMASLLQWGDRLLFVNPSSDSTRNQITLKMSFDNGLTWPRDHWVLLDAWNGAGYSCLCAVNDSTLGVLYEGSQAQLTFQLVSLKK